MTVEIRVDKRFARWVDKRSLIRMALHVIRIESMQRRQLTAVITDDRTIRDYNHRFHRVNSSTDVLSFGSDAPDYLGDVLISYETARKNASRAGWRVRDELELLLVHGILHLVGYDDATKDQRERMWKRQAVLLRKNIPG